ncbi:GL16630 [Drosophila persimilis]|uniref:GL16630 n=1 Tax=Drosophila persimilis TaxID=7234 RepID=B4HCL4_DROPE|nr:GL16630 [Drosophila persimilis]
MANFQVLMSNSLTEDRAGPSFAKQQQQQQQEVEQALQAPAQWLSSQHNGNFVACDRGNGRSRMQIFSKCVTYMFKISIRFMDIVTGLAVTAKGHIVAVDSVSPTVFVISEEGMLLHGFDCSVFVREPSDIAIRHNVFYLCDMKAHGVAVFKDSGEFLYRIGNERVSCYPTGIDIFSAGDLLIGDTHGYRFHVTYYGSDGVFKSVIEFPHLNVSRCCGLKITSEGYVVTLAKNNHQVLVMDLLLSAVHSKATPMKIGWKFGCLGAGFCLGIDEDIVVADSKNHRIAVYAKMGALKFQFGDAGKRNGQLFYPRKVAVFQHNGNFVVCDRGNGRSRMQIFSNCTANLQSPTCPVNSNILYIADHYEYSFFNFSYIKFRVTNV